MITNIPPNTSTRRLRRKSIDSVIPKSKGIGFNIGFGSINRTYKEEAEPFEVHQIKKLKTPHKATLILESLLNETLKHLNQIVNQIKLDCSDYLLNEHSRLESLIAQLKRQIIVKKTKCL